MERQSHQGGEHTHEHEPPTPIEQATEAPDHPTPAAEASSADEPALVRLNREALDLTYQAITEALRDGRAIDHETARVIAAIFYDTPDSALGILAMTGVVTEGLAAELHELKATAPSELEPWLDALDEYVANQAASPEPAGGWSELRPAQTDAVEVTGDQAVPIDELIGEPPDEQVGTVQELGWFGLYRHHERPGGLIITQDEDGLRHGWETDSADDLDDRWQQVTERYSQFYSSTDDISPDDQTSTAEQPAVSTTVDQDQTQPEPAAVENSQNNLPSAEHAGRLINDRTARDIARQFRQDVDGPLDVFVRFGVVLNENDELYEELFDGWEQHTPEQQRQVEALRSYIAGRQNYGPVSHWAEDRAPTPSGIQPEIWVGTLNDYNSGVLHGVWIDADQDVDELRETVGWLLLSSPTARAHREVAEEYGIFDYAGFGDYQVSEWSSLETVAMIAHGIAEHGLAYAAWVDYVGDTAGELLDDTAFRDHYEGEWDSLTDYVEYVLEETGFTQTLNEALQALPEDMRRHVRLDVEGVAEEWEQGLHVVEAPGGRVWVFSAR